MLYRGEVDDKTLYLKGKRFIEAKAVKGTVTISIDDSIQEKPHSAVNGLVGWQTIKTKNELFRQMVQRLTRSKKVDDVLSDAGMLPLKT